MPKVKNIKRKYLEAGGSYYRNPNKNLWFFDYNYRDEHGCKAHKRLQAKTESMLQTKIKAFFTSLNNPNKTQITTINELADAWINNDLKDNIAINTIANYTYRLKYIKDEFGKRDINNITINEIETFLNKLSKSGGAKKQGIAPKSVNDTRKILSALYKYAKQHNITDNDPTFGIRPKKIVKLAEEDSLCILSEEEMKHFIQTAKEGNYIYNGVENKKEIVINDAMKYNIRTTHMLVLLGFSTGMRIGELRGLRKENIDLENKQIHVTHQLLQNSLTGHRLSRPEVEVLKEKALKTKKYRDTMVAMRADPFQPLKTAYSKRVIYIDESLKNEIMEYLKYQDQYAKEHKEYHNEWELLLTNSFGAPIDEKNFANRHFSKVLKESGINKPLTPHKMRHTHASILLKHGVNIAVVSRRLGHSDITVTSKVYLHVLPESSAEVGTIWGDVIKEKAS